MQGFLEISVMFFFNLKATMYVADSCLLDEGIEKKYPCIVLNNWSWKQTNVSFEAFLVGNQGWHIKGQMLR